MINKPVLAVIVMAVVTIVLRFIPFLIFSDKRKTPNIITYLGKVLPPAVMGMLVIYCLKDTSFSSFSGFVPQLTASAFTIASYIWKRNTLVSIVLGTAVYMMLV